MRWQLSNPEGTLAGVPLKAVLEAGGLLPCPPLDVPADAALERQRAWLMDRLREFKGGGESLWLVLPERERSEQQQWQGQVPEGVGVTFGRSGVTLALGQASRLQGAATVLAIDAVPGASPDRVIESQFRLDLEPADTGLAFPVGLVDGRPGRPTDLSALMEQGSRAAPDPEVLIMPGTGSDGSLNRLMGSLAAMEKWIDRGIRWEFAEARIGPLGVVGSLFNRYWLQEGYRLGEWRGTAVIMDMDTSPLAGLSVVDFNA